MVAEHPDALFDLLLWPYLVLLVHRNSNSLRVQCDVFVQEAHPTEVPMELIDQLMPLSSGNMPSDVATLFLSPQKGRWGEDSDPTTPLGGRTFSDLSDEVSPICRTVNWDEPQASRMLSLPPGEPLSPGICLIITAASL